MCSCHVIGLRLSGHPLSVIGSVYYMLKVGKPLVHRCLGPAPFLRHRRKGLLAYLICSSLSQAPANNKPCTVMTLLCTILSTGTLPHWQGPRSCVPSFLSFESVSFQK